MDLNVHLVQGLLHPLHGSGRFLAWVRTPVSLTREEAWNLLVGPEVLAAQGSLADIAEGSRYEIVAATGDRFEGTVQVFHPPKDFAATVNNAGDAWLLASVETFSGQREVWIWLQAYRMPEEEVAAFRDRWSRLLHDRFVASR